MSALPFGLNEGDKFAILALTNVGSKVKSGFTLSDGTVVSPEIPREFLDDFWRNTLGSMSVEALRRCNLALIRRTSSVQPEVLDGEHESLFRAVADLFWLLQLSGIPYYERANVLKGSVIKGKLNLRALEDLSNHHFVPSKDGKTVQITQARLAGAAILVSSWQSMLVEAKSHARFKRGLNVLLDGLQQAIGQERLHASVRALEGLILPKIGQTKKEFVKRCGIFAVPSATSEKALRESYDLRSDAEHMHEADRSLIDYPPHKREAIASCRVRQIEALASFAYSQILSKPDLQVHFSDDASLAAFWALPEAKRTAAWGPTLDLAAVK